MMGMSHGPSRIVLAVTGAIALSGCGILDAGCGTGTVPAIVVEIYDSMTGNPAAYEAEGWVEDGSYMDPLTPYGSITDDPTTLFSLRAAVERTGTYDVFVEKEGYEDWTATNVEVQQGRCHVRTRVLFAELVPAPVA
jgi:hypothetical protein